MMLLELATQRPSASAPCSASAGREAVLDMPFFFANGRPMPVGLPEAKNACDWRDIDGFPFAHHGHKSRSEAEA